MHQVAIFDVVSYVSLELFLEMINLTPQMHDMLCDVLMERFSCLILKIFLFDQAQFPILLLQFLLDFFKLNQARSYLKGCLNWLNPFIFKIVIFRVSRPVKRMDFGFAVLQIPVEVLCFLIQFDRVKVFQQSTLLLVFVSNFCTNFIHLLQLGR